MYASLGTIKFQGLKGFDKFDTSASVNFTEHARIQNKPGLQMVGQNLETIDMSIQFHRQFCVPEDEIRAFSTARINGEILPLVLGNGVYLGDYVIMSMNQSIKQTDPRGGIIHVVVDAQLKEFYDPNKLQTREALARVNSFASDPLNTVPIVRPPDIPLYSHKEIADRARNISIQAGSIESDMNGIRSFPEQVDYYSGMINKSLGVVNGDISRMNAVLVEGELLAQAGDLQTALDALGRFVQDFLAIDPATDFPGAEAANTALQSGVLDVSRTSTSISNSVIVRRLQNG